MEEKKLKLAINRMVLDVNLYSKYLEMAKQKNLPLIVERLFLKKSRNKRFYVLSWI